MDLIVEQTRVEWARVGAGGRLLAGAMILLLGGLAARNPADMRRLARLTAVFGLGAVASLSIPFLTVVVPQVMTEEIMAIQLAACLLLSLAFASVVRVCSRYLAASSSEPAIVAG